MSQLFIRIALLVAGVVHCLPLVGVLGAKELEMLYGVSGLDPVLVALLQHRAVLFGLLGVFFVMAAFRRALQALAIGGGLIAVSSFLLLVVLSDFDTSPLNQVVVADLLVLALLIPAAVVAILQARARATDTIAR